MNEPEPEPAIDEIDEIDDVDEPAGAPAEGEPSGTDG
jgi:hypothetical protein